MPETTQISVQVSLKRQTDGTLLAEMASESHVCERTLRNLVKSAANPRLKTLKELAVYMGVSISNLLALESSHGFDLYTDDPQDISVEIEALSLWLNTFRHISKETQLDFAIHTGVCLDTINRIERKLPDCNPRLSTLQHFAAYMGITVSELLNTTLTAADMERLLKERLDKHE